VESYQDVNKWIEELDIAEGLKQLLIDTGLTIESTVRYGYQEVSEILQRDPYVGKIIVEAAQKVIQEIHSGRCIIMNCEDQNVYLILKLYFAILH
jgi:hypothetical protein